ncbi:hypothetical protein [Hymenobacter pini]|uniref:hypothetical protein n=1 Tax=Hymenobacter pini TaxID=2880879 RepID=UPI001CF5CD98|nr:hypothetical protein [Hymenobacter pini]MCA8829431.1 hypothetical protein [Hymenobacter pini]
MEQKVISLNVNINGPRDKDSQALNFPEVNEALEQGFFVKDVISSPVHHNSWVGLNLTFILQKG